MKNKDGSIADLEVSQDGKLIEVKHDDATDALVGSARPGHNAFPGARFSHSQNITNPYLPLRLLKKDILEGTEGGGKTLVERSARRDKHKVFKVNGQKVEAAAFEDRQFVNGNLKEDTIDYFAQDDVGNVYYLGEEVNDFENGKVTGHEGGWMLGKNTNIPGLLLPAHPKVGDRFNSEDVSKVIREIDEIVSVSGTVTVPAGKFQDCLKVAEHPSGEGVEYKYYAKGVGVVREQPADGDELLVSHTSE